ncbi:MAG: type II toxin-antitoxin system prevent-host-death family antitoxin [Acidobacteria bacterium]|nr:MAG: type II toxin-antitoxin system prevent-host-death family antitoxin [Acidobacteriota bacterium]RPJ87271.1 MAG: type II toxin-antitoxin system prevent-host-death family antitoxin [Acidobacteriota bacterium]
MSVTGKTVGTFEAKTKFSELLERVSRGEEITITRHEKPIARLVPVHRFSVGAVEEAFVQMEKILRRTQRKSARREKLSYRKLIEEGRRR